MARTLTALLLALACAACVDFIEPELPNADGSFGLELVIDEDSIRVDALLIPGQSESGDPRVITSAGMLIGDQVLLPVSSEYEGDPALTYETVRARIHQATGLVVQAPSVEGIPVLGRFRVQSIRRNGPDTITIDAGDPAVLTIHVPADSSQWAAQRMWTLGGSDGPTALQTVVRDRLPPTTISIPPYFMPSDGTFRVSLIDRQMLIDRDDATSFRWFVSAMTRIEWTVHIVPASDSTDRVS